MTNLPSDQKPDSIFEWPGSSGPLHLRLYQGAPDKLDDDLLVFFHPGGFVVADVESTDACLRVLADSCRINVLAPCYALAPQRPFPAAVEDAHAVLTLTSKHRSALGWKGTRLFVGGVEAGGNLAAVSALVCRDRQGPKLAGQVLIMPMLDACMHSESMRHAADQPDTREIAKSLERCYRSYLPHPSDRLHPYASPMKTSRLAGLPPALIIYTQGDPLADEARTYADRLIKVGVPVQQTSLPPADVNSVSERCALTSDDPSVTALAAFLQSCRSSNFPSSTSPQKPSQA
ncbi:MAG: alpha/beta hydrolase [Rubrivivax sp.]|nr:MAG: alpha/beta hydrolase [Rubrivivax sp.]